MVRISLIKLAKMRRLCNTLDIEPQLWPMYESDFREFIDDAEDYINRLRAEKRRLRGSSGPSGNVIRGQQIKHRKRLWDTRPRVCEDCGMELTWKLYKLHHIEEVKDAGGFDDNNLLMLCANCHSLRH